MKGRAFTPEKIIGLLRQAEVELAQGKRVGEVCRGWGSRNRVTIAGAALKKAVAELTLDKQILKEALEGNF
jgi:hypothetical protein